MKVIKRLAYKSEEHQSSCLVCIILLLNLVLLAKIHLRHVSQKYGVKSFRDLYIVCRAQRMAAELIEVELGNVAGTLRDVKSPAPDLQMSVMRNRLPVPSRNSCKDLIHFVDIFSGEWVEVNVGESPGYSAVIWIANVNMLQFLREECDLPVSESRLITSNLVLRSSIQGIKLDLWMPFLYSSSGGRLIEPSAE